ncbi:MULTISPECIES: hypothetical protein [unclassified Lysinibacillus]|uniref:hypothetical protein n=1 Tax=unclassified Lysinibacillus TaxID=2636778 RepID=UPI00201173B4|nr:MULTISPECIES: hypothetical protein [unclassified Lysinibacillus]MCL1698179.1 hypothetical protein [Lysinibacillus sp. BPa_S21]MCL1702537.1 hypothetical protein [Lysinibacillus sp. Bpr_S20]
MIIGTMSVVIFMIVWGIPAFMVVRGYLKMNTDDKKSAINDFRSRHFIFTIGFIVIGFFFTHLGMLFAVSIIRIIGIPLMILGGIFSALTTSKESKIRIMLILIVLSIIISVNII